MTEWRLVELLVRNPGKIVSRRTLLREVRGMEQAAETNYLRVYRTTRWSQEQRIA